MSRRHREEQPFGSDSFLDVIANIVGILIILIVIVGMKVARQATELPVSEATDVVNQQTDSVADEMRELQADIDNAQEAWKRSSRVHSEAVLESEQLADQLIALNDEINGLTSDVATLSDREEDVRNKSVVTQLELARVQSAAKELEDKQQRLQTELASVENHAVHTDFKLAKLTQELSEAESEGRLIAAETQRLQEVLKETVASTVGPVDSLQHRLAPVSILASEDEVHFRLSNGRVSHIPVDALIERLKSQIKSRSSAIQRFSRYEGTVGPVEGYMMSYVVQREGLSALQSMQYGASGYRVSVSRWSIAPTENILAEDPATAVRPGSRFRQTVETLRPGSTVTIWTYPDSFSDFPPLRELAHGLQLRVAARPLPEGTPIVGSPAGSQSRAQ